MKRDRDGQYLIATIATERNETSKQIMEIAEELKTKYKTMEENEVDFGEKAWGDVSGVALDPKEIERARREEIDYVHKMHLYDKVCL